MDMGKNKRMQHIFRPDGHAIITAFDHGVNSGPVPGIVHLDQALQTVKDAGTDAVLVTIGMAKKYGGLLGSTGMIVRMDFPCTDYIHGSRDSELCATVEEAVRAGADAVIFNGGPDSAKGEVALERTMMRIIGTLRRECDRYGMPLIAEVVPGGFNPPPEAITIDSLKLGARVAAEAGADALKMPYRPGYEAVVEGCEGLPIVVLGGAKTNSQEQFFANIADAMKAGAKGVAIGRNIWGHEHPDRVIRLLDTLIHQGKDLQTAMACLAD